MLLQRLADSVLIYFTYEPRDTFKSFGSFLTVKIISKLDMEHSVKFEIEILKKISGRGSTSPDNAEFGHLKLLFCKVRQRNVPII